jgi:alkanesulfonate monooxygenase SsuD/methylene tetrahydromethanopterin reductase-like flavin-dependent oxidoreductase (luciferase family)
MFLAGLVPQTKNIMLGTAVINLPNHHPAIVAAEAAQFDHMSKGRFMLGVGPGGLVSDFELFKRTDHAARNRMVAEAMTMVETIWSQDPPYRLNGEFWNIEITDAIMPELGVGFMPKPYQQPRPPIMISLASPSSPSAKTAAERGWGIISANIIPV